MIYVLLALLCLQANDNVRTEWNEGVIKSVEVDTVNVCCEGWDRSFYTYKLRYFREGVEVRMSEMPRMPYRARFVWSWTDDGTTLGWRVIKICADVK
jgi:hypothetical protein